MSVFVRLQSSSAPSFIPLSAIYTVLPVQCKSRYSTLLILYHISQIKRTIRTYVSSVRYTLSVTAPTHITDPIYRWIDQVQLTIQILEICQETSTVRKPSTYRDTRCSRVHTKTEVSRLLSYQPASQRSMSKQSRYLRLIHTTYTMADSHSKFQIYILSSILQYEKSLISRLNQERRN